MHIATLRVLFCIADEGRMTGDELRSCSWIKLVLEPLVWLEEFDDAPDAHDH
jgi:hypothetical protein